MYAVPKDFQFPSVKLRQAVRYWLCGLSVASADGSQRVRPFRKLQPQILPNRLRNPFKLNWKPLFEFLSKGDKVIPEYSSAALPNEEEIEDCYRRCVAHLKTHVSYCFKANGDPTSSWNLSTWAVRVARSSIEKNGTNADKEKLGAATNRNKARGSNQKRKRKEKANPRHRQQKRKNRTTSATSDTTTAAPRNTTAATARAAVTTPAPGAGVSGLTFESVFGHVQMTQAQQARDHTINQEVLAEMEQDQARHRDERARVGDAVATDGTVLYTRQPTGRILHNNGDNSRNARDRYVSLLDGVVNNGGTPCYIPGCAWARNVPDHPCYRRLCTRLIHNLCAQANNLTDDDNELNMFCSPACKSRHKADTATS